MKPLSPRLRAALAGLLLVAATVAAYAPALSAGYVWDDDDYVTENPLLWEPDGLRRIWLSTDVPSQYFPLVYTTYRLEYALWGLEPFGYHLVNVLLHAANALLVWWVLARLAVPGALLAAAIFALHPVHVESVAWITERKNTLSTLFFLLSLLGWMRYTEPGRGRLRHYLGSLASYQLALFAKTTACVLPAALVLALWVRGRPLDRRRWLEIGPYVGLGLAMGLLTLSWERSLQGTLGERFSPGWPGALLVAGKALWFYLGKLAWPADLAFSYPKFAIDPGDPLHWLPGIAFLALVALLFALRQRIGRGPVAALVFFTATLSPLLGFIPLFTFLYTYVADHYQYVASIGPIALVAGAGTWALRTRGPAVRRGAAAAAGLVLAVLAALTFQQSRVYEGRETLWRDVMAKNPGSWMARHNLGDELLRQERLPEAAEAFREALALREDLDKTHRNLAVVLWRLGRRDEAMHHAEEALRHNPDFVPGLATLGGFRVARGEAAQALPAYERMVALAPRRPEAHAGFGRALAALGRDEEAQARFRAALERDPAHVPALLGLAALLSRCADDPARGREAVELVERAQARFGSAPAVWAALARARAAAGLPRQADAAARRASALARRSGQLALAQEIERDRTAYRRGEAWCPDGADGDGAWEP